MGRPKKATVDYFPHYCHHGKTLYILENLYGNDGYAFFYKLLEALGDSEGHYYDCRDATSWEFLQAKTRTDEITTCSILDKLSNMGIIDPELWKIRVIWMETFTSSIKDVYLNRRVSIPTKPMVSEFLHVETTHIEGVSTGENPQSKVKYSKVKKDMPESGLSLFDSFYQNYPVKKAKQDAIKAWKKINPENGTVELILQSIQRQKKHNEELKRKGEFVPEWPYPATWLNGRRWEDEVPDKQSMERPVFGLSDAAKERIEEIERKENGH